MRLKFLFFPIILIISICIIAAYIWPEVTNARMLSDDKQAKQSQLEAIKIKQNAIEKLGNQISSDSSGDTLVNNYLPSVKIEEKIISGINFLAVDSGVSLVNLSIKDATNTNVATTTGVTANILTGLPTSPDAAANTANTNTPVKNDEVQSSEATIAVSGDYNKIKLFLDQIQHMPIYNQIKSVEITTAQAGKTDGAQVDSSILSATIVSNFGYLAKASIDNQKVNKFDPTLDSQTILTLKNYISQKAPGADSSGDSNGKANPFLP